MELGTWCWTVQLRKRLEMLSYRPSVRREVCAWNQLLDGFGFHGKMEKYYTAVK